MARAKKSAQDQKDIATTSALPAGAGKPDGIKVANDELDRLYQEVRAGKPHAEEVLRALNLVLRMKMRLIEFRRWQEAKK